MASAFGKLLMVRIRGAGIFLDPICAVHLKISCQFVAPVFGIQLLIELEGTARYADLLRGHGSLFVSH